MATSVVAVDVGDAVEIAVVGLGEAMVKWAKGFKGPK
jgi:hypothetical protein